MSDDGPFGGPDVAGDPTGAPAEDGYTETQQFEEAPRSYLDVDDDLANRYVRVKVDGQDMEVPLREALSGYSRTADYTRKTQDLAAQRQEAEYALAVQRALQAAPEETIRLLGRQYGMNLDQPTAGAPEPSPYGLDDDAYLSPMEKRLAQIEVTNRQLQERYEAEQANSQLQRTIGELKQRYQVNDETVREVVGIALQQGRGPESFDMIFKSLAFDRAMQARQAAADQQQANTQRRQAAGANAAQVIGNGSSATRAAAPLSEAPARNLSLAEAFDLAEREPHRR